MAPEAVRNSGLIMNVTDVRDVAMTTFGNTVDQLLLLLHITICIVRHINFGLHHPHADQQGRLLLEASLPPAAARRRAAVTSLFGNCAVEVTTDGRERLANLIVECLTKRANAILMATAVMLIGGVEASIARPQVRKDDLRGRPQVGLPPRGLAQLTGEENAKIKEEMETDIYVEVHIADLMTTSKELTAVSLRPSTEVAALARRAKARTAADDDRVPDQLLAHNVRIATTDAEVMTVGLMMTVERLSASRMLHTEAVKLVMAGVKTGLEFLTGAGWKVGDLSKGVEALTAISTICAINMEAVNTIRVMMW